jgi:amino acid permease
MSQRLRSNKNKKRRGFTYLWIFGLAVLIFLLIYFEQTALLYVLATLGVTALLVIVALADLGRGELSTETATQIPEASIRPPGAKTRK